MSWSDRRNVLFSCLALGACGLTPVYAPGGAADGMRGAISFDDPADSAGFVLVRALEDRLGPPEAPRYGLSATILIEEEGAGITPEQVITRFRLLGTVDFALTDIATGEVVTRGRVSNFTGYSTTGNTVAVRAAAADAARRLMRILADQIVSRLLITAPEWLE